MKKCIDCEIDSLVFEGENEYEPDIITGEPRCFSCDLKANPQRYEEPNR